MRRASPSAPRLRTGPGRSLWPVLLLLVLAVVTPTACVLWFMTQAIGNERLAVRQRLINAYEGQFVAIRQAIDEFWNDRVRRLDQHGPAGSPGESFARLVASDVADAVVLLDPQGLPAYPDVDRLPPPAAQDADPSWQQATEAEHARNDLARAADLYARIAADSPEADHSARALAAQARCLGKTGQVDAALRVVLDTLGEPRYRGARDSLGRLVVPNAQLLALTLAGDRAAADRHRAADLLRTRLADYAPPDMPASQRLFLMTELRRLAPDLSEPAAFRAESLAAAFVEKGGRPTGARALVRSPIPGVWQWTADDRRAVALFLEDPLIRTLEAHAGRAAALPSDAVLHLTPPGDARGAGEPLIAAPAGKPLPDWQLAVYLTGPDPFAAAARRRITAYLWTGILVIGAAAGLVLLLARSLGRQVRLTRLKNDLIATVSHELKTPLTSIRVLTDTLLAGQPPGQPPGETRSREYLEMIARENLRLSRLIDNFLTFSRMERNKRQFDLREVRPADLVTEAVEAVRDRYEAGGFALEVRTEPGLPTVLGDRDALVTVLVNLLDNAYKYCRDDRRVRLRAYAADGEIRFEVADRGPGIPRRDLRRIFDKFYQVDRSLSREAGGVGLGLSIVRFIVDAHGGRVDVASRPGQGTTFTVRLPASGPREGGTTEQKP